MRTHSSCSLFPGNQILTSKYLARRGVVVSGARGVEQWIRMATDYKMVVVPDTGGTRCMVECPQSQQNWRVNTYAHDFREYTAADGLSNVQ